MDRDSVRALTNTQIGYRWLNIFEIRPHRANNVIVAGEVQRNELRPFFNKWGASHLYFESYGKPIKEPLITTGKTTLALALPARGSKILYLPFQRDHRRKEDFLDGLSSLIDCLLTYVTKSLTSIPAWGQAPFFEEEVKIRAKCDGIESDLRAEQAKLVPYEDAKMLLFQSEYALESSLPRFFAEKLSLQTERNERFKEDFWIVDETGKRRVLVEVKSTVKGFKKSLVFAAYSHREENQIADNFPTLLVANCNLQAANWTDKARPIDKQDYEVAAQNHVLILRVEDLTRLWQMKEAGQIDSSGILNLLETNVGWLEVAANYSFQVWK
jgi:hypothetical protein